MDNQSIGVNPDAIFPNEHLKNQCYIKNVVKAPNIKIGDFTYYEDPVDSTQFEEKCVLFNWPQFGDQLIIGSFCAIANGVTFLMGSANHRMGSVTTYPFSAFGGAWEAAVSPHLSQLPRKGDTVIGNDVWIGRESLIMPGVRIGHGAIIAARSVVSKDVPPYTIVGGNPASVIKPRFDDELIGLLKQLKWWDFRGEKLLKWLPVLCNENIAEVKQIIFQELHRA